MSDQPDQQTKELFLHVVECASGIAGDVGKLITAAQEANWDVGVSATPQGLGFIDTTAIEAQADRTNPKTGGVFVRPSRSVRAAFPWEIS